MALGACLGAKAQVRSFDLEGTKSPLLFINMIEKSKIEALVNAKIEGSDIFLVEIHVSPKNNIVVVIDSDNGLSIDRCIEVSRAVEHNLDRELEDFSLEVTSYGLDKPLILRRQYEKNIGRNLSITLNDGTKLKGELEKVGQKSINIIRKLNKKEIKEGKETNLSIDFSEIKETKIEISFK